LDFGERESKEKEGGEENEKGGEDSEEKGGKGENVNSVEQVEGQKENVEELEVRGIEIEEEIEEREEFTGGERALA